MAVTFIEYGPTIGYTYTLSCTIPTGAIAGDLMVYGFSHQLHGSVDFSDFATKGWTTLQANYGYSDAGASVFYKIHSGSESPPDAYIDYWHMMARATVWRGADQTTPIPEHAVSTGTTTGSAACPTPSVDNSALYQNLALQDGIDISISHSGLTGVVYNKLASTNQGNDGTLYGSRGWRTPATAPGSWTNTLPYGKRWSSIVAAIAPAGAGGGPKKSQSLILY